MKCCVPNCPNTYDKNIKTQGLSFQLPKDPDQGAAWIKALAAAGCRISLGLAVCCEHFLPDDFDDSRSNQRRLQPGVVPTLLPQCGSRAMKSVIRADPGEDGGANLKTTKSTGQPKTKRNGKNKVRPVPSPVAAVRTTVPMHNQPNGSPSVEKGDPNTRTTIQAENNANQKKLCRLAPFPTEKFKLAPIPPEELKSVPLPLPPEELKQNPFSSFCEKD